MGTEPVGTGAPPEGGGAGAAGEPLAPRGELASLLLRGREALEKQDLATAHADFQRAHALDTGHPAAMSYFGLTLTMVEHEHDKGLLLCEEAVKRAGAQPELLVNLGRACIAARQKRHAVKALTQASRLAPGDPRVEAAWAELGRRDRPVLPWFSRNFFLNRWLGRLRYRWRMRNAPPEEDAP